VTSYQSYNFLHGGRDAGIIYLNKKKKKKKKKKKGMGCFILITKSFQMIILKRHFLVRSVALFKEIMPRTSIWSRVPISTV